jgi:ferredoxin
MPLLKVVDRDGKEHDVEMKSGLKLMEALRELDYGIAAICGGMCSCMIPGAHRCRHRCPMKSNC